jgi:acetolactate synthase-1/2/3 large subunit
MAATTSTALAYLELLAARGIGHLFGNAGTDFAPLIEAYAQAAQRGAAVPRPILAAHENLAVAMAHGYAMVARKVPAVMVHVSVGTANMACAAMNAARENVAMLLTAGRTPITEAGMLGSRDGHIHWAQEMYDQAGMLREIVKWDYELRTPEQLETIVDRALAIATSEPSGPVYLSLPREVLAAPAAGRGGGSRQAAAAPPAPDPAAIAGAARMLAAAQHPLIITANAGRDPAAFSAMSALAERFALGVVHHHPRYLSLPSAHAMNLGYDPAPLLAAADCLLVVECDVPWLPAHASPARGCKVIHAALDPLYRHIPVRGFASDLAITGGTAAILEALGDALAAEAGGAEISARRTAIAARRAALEDERSQELAAARARVPIDPAWVSHCVGAAKPAAAIVVNEYPLRLEHCAFAHADCFFGSSAASGLGWGAGAVLGAKLAAPERTAIAVLGDGAYLFSNPAAVHHAAALHELPVLFVIVNNGMWNAVSRFTAAMYPGGSAAQSNWVPFTRLDRLPCFAEICRAAGGHGERVEDPAALPAALARALKIVAGERRQALLDVICCPG